jgi:hypothetical protein
MGTTRRSNPERNPRNPRPRISVLDPAPFPLICEQSTMQLSVSVTPLRADSRAVKPAPGTSRRRWHASHGAILALGFGAIVIVGAGFAAIADSNRRTALRDGAARIEAQADVLAQQTAHLVDLSNRVALQAAALTANRAWPGISAARDLFASLQRVAEQAPHAQAIWLADSTGLPRLSSRGFPARAESVAGDPAFLAHAKQEGPALLSRIVERRAVSTEDSEGARQVEQPGFALTRRITATDGSFGGIVAVVLDPAAVMPPVAAPFALRETIVGIDGRVLLSNVEGASGEQALDPQRLRAQAAVGAVEADGRIAAYRAVGDALFIGVSASRADVLAAWRAATARDGAVLALALGFIAVFVAIAAARATSEARLRTALAPVPTPPEPMRVPERVPATP